MRTLATARTVATSRSIVPLAQNLIYPSEGLTGWYLNNVTFGTPISGPTINDTIVTLDQVIESASTSQHNVYGIYSGTKAGQLHTESCYVKKGVRDWIALSPDNASPKVFYNLADGTIGNTYSGATGKIEDVGGGYWRISITFTAGSTSGVMRVYGSSSGSVGGLSYAGTNGATAFYFGGAQSVQANWAGIYKKTTSSAYNLGPIRSLATSRTIAT